MQVAKVAILHFTKVAVLHCTKCGMARLHALPCMCLIAVTSDALAAIQLGCTAASHGQTGLYVSPFPYTLCHCDS